MFKISQEELHELALVGVKIGANVQKGQPLVIQGPVEAFELIRECTKVAYEVGASSVYVEYHDGIRSRLSFENESEEDLCEVPEWAIKKYEYSIKKDACFLHIVGEDPDQLAGIDPKLLQKVSLSRMNATNKFQYYTMNNIGQWSIIAYPEVHWAKKIFPDKSDDEAMEALWQAIKKTSRIEVGKSEENWIKHNEEVKVHARKLNEFNFKALYFKNSLGTDLRVELIKDHFWEGGCDYSRGKYKTEFNPNIPTEEVFTMPNRYHIDGKVYSTKPLSYNGNIIPSFNLTFKDGKVVDYDAEINKSVLENIINTDEGSKSLGEVALISHDSPISNTNILFYDTLFDENASCHLALGACYPTNVKNGDNLSKEELFELGGNDSMNHVDFMFGSSDMSIMGETYDGQMIEVFKDGNFVF